MKIQHFLLPTIALGGAAFLLLPAQTDAFTTLGGSLGTGQRHVRVFDNFTDPGANDNVTPDANFPGYTGCELAIWKAVTEWGSQLHANNGNGDAHQPGGLGSGGANFDAFWQGNAAGVGGTNGNIVSELLGSDGGTLAFTESPISDGWRIRFYSTWNWADGPGASVSGQDIQGVMTHEYGHALGLDHTTVGGSTMTAGLFGSGVTSRSIAPDDIAGVQFVYGVVATSKPRITGIENNAGQLVVHGFGFDPITNDVWFCPIGTSSGAPAVIASGAGTANGSLITVTIPGTAGPGDIIVKTPASGNASLSNAWPFDPADFPVAPGIAYCFGDGSLPTPCPCAPPDTVPSPSGGPDSGCANSFNANGARLDAAGRKNPSDQVQLTASGLTPAGFTFFISGNANDAGGIVNGDGVKCAGGSFVRFGSQVAINGGAIYPNPGAGFTALLSTVSGVTPGGGATRYYQGFYRNVTAGFCSPATTNMTSAVQIDWN